jgi:hypothetical protein
VQGSGEDGFDVKAGSWMAAHETWIEWWVCVRVLKIPRLITHPTDLSGRVDVKVTMTKWSHRRRVEESYGESGHKRYDRCPLSR